LIHLIVGNTGAGKTTYANKLKGEIKGLVFSIDFWNKTLFLPDKKPEDGLEWFLERIEREEAVMMELIIQLEAAGVDTILDLGFSKKTHRDKFRNFAKENGFETKLHYLDIPKEVRWERVKRRNNEKGESFAFEVSQADFDFMETWFEKPSKSE
jgi:predicted kinase